MGNTLEDMDVETEQKDNKMKLLEKKIGLPDCKVIEEMNRLVINKTSSKRKKLIGLWVGSIIHWKITNTIKIKKTIKLKFLNKSFALIMVCL